MNAAKVSGSEGLSEKVTQMVLFEEFQATFIETVSLEALSNGLEKLHGNNNLVNILETLQDYEVPDEAMREKKMGEFRQHVMIMYLIKQNGRPSRFLFQAEKFVKQRLQDIVYCTN